MELPSLPQWCRLALGEPRELDCIQIAWGLDFNRTAFQFLADSSANWDGPGIVAKQEIMRIPE